MKVTIARIKVKIV